LIKQSSVHPKNIIHIDYTQHIIFENNKELSTYININKNIY